MDIFNWFGSILGYILWFLYSIVQNYGVAILLFTILVRAAMYPLTIKQQKSMAASGRLAAKQKELQARYGNDKQKYQEEVQKLYQQEGVSPGSGCLVSLIPFPIMMGLYYTVINPLSNAVHMSSTAINSATTMLGQIPGIGATVNGRFVEMEVIKKFDILKPYLSEVWNADEMAQVDKFAHSFNFLGLDLLQTPWGGSWVLWIIPVLCLIFSIGTQIYSMKTNDAMKQQQGCMKVTFLLLPLLTAYLAVTMPAAIGFYWVVSNALTFVQTFITNQLFSKDHMTAEQEARRIARRVREEAHVPEIPLAERRVITNQSVQNQGVNPPKNQQNKSKKKKK